MPLITGPQRARSKINWARAVLEPAIVLAGAPEKETALVAALELVIGPAVVPELERAPVAALEQVLVLVAARELEQVLAQVVEPEQPIAQLVVALRTKSVTTAHRPDLVPLLAGEDLVVAAETTREPVAAEAAKAWAAAE
jgi:hypothetical protein